MSEGEEGKKTKGTVWALRQYFTTPPTAGFAPYRTGQTVHLFFAAAHGGLFNFLIEKYLELPHLITFILVAASVLIFWGVGTLIGILSHYNPLIMLAAFGLAFGAMKAGWLPGMLVGGGSYLAFRIVLPKYKFDQE